MKQFCKPHITKLDMTNKNPMEEQILINQFNYIYGDSYIITRFPK